MLETLLGHLDSAANGAPAEAPAEGAEEPKKDDAAPAEVRSCLRGVGGDEMYA